MQRQLLRFAVAALGRRRMATRHRIASILGRFMAHVVPIRRGVVDENLRLAFPEWSAAQRKKVIVESYVTLVRNSIDSLAMAIMTREEIQAGVEQPMNDRGQFEALKKSGKGFIIATAHIGDWEWGGAFIATLGVELADVAKPLESPVMQKFATDVRERHNIKLISTEDSPLRIVRHLKSGGVLSLFTDQNVRHDGVFVPFFGRDASTAPGAGYLAYRLGVPVLPMWGYRTRDGRIRAIVDDAIWADPSKPMDAEIERITRYHVKCLENAIRQNPGQYFWFHRRWKTRPKPAAAESPAQPPSTSPSISRA